MSKKLTCCARCGRALVHHEDVHAVEGTLYCSKTCAINDIMDEYIQNAKELAIEAYNDKAEVVAASEILSEDLQTVAVSVKYTTYVKLPITLSEQAALDEAMKLHREGFVSVDEDDFDSIDVTYELVIEKNSTEED